MIRKFSEKNILINHLVKLIFFSIIFLFKFNCMTLSEKSQIERLKLNNSNLNSSNIFSVNLVNRINLRKNILNNLKNKSEFKEINLLQKEKLETDCKSQASYISYLNKELVNENLPNDKITEILETKIHPDKKSSELRESKEKIGHLTWKFLHTLGSSYPIIASEEKQNSIKSFLEKM